MGRHTWYAAPLGPVWSGLVLSCLWSLVKITLLSM